VYTYSGELTVTGNALLHALRRLGNIILDASLVFELREPGKLITSQRAQAHTFSCPTLQAARL